MEKPRRVIREHKWFVIIGTTNVIIMYTVGVQYSGTVSGGGGGECLPITNGGVPF